MTFWPLQARIETVADEDELDEVYETERHLFLRGLYPSERSPADIRGQAGI